MGAIGEAFAGAIEGAGSVGLGIYNAWRKQRNQEIQWNREDTAIQRQVKDAQAAGFNKWSVLGGSGAASHTDVASAGTVNEDMAGAASDALTRMYQIGMLRSSSKKAEADAAKANAERDIAFNLKKQSDWTAALNIAGMMRDAGFMPGFQVNRNSEPRLVNNNITPDTWYDNASTPQERVRSYLSGDAYETKNFNDVPFGKAWQLDFDQLEAATKTAQTDAEWRTTNYIIGLLGRLIGGAEQVGATYGHFKREYKSKK